MNTPDVIGDLGLKFQNMTDANATTAFMMNGVTTADSTVLTPHTTSLFNNTNAEIVSYHLILNMSPSKIELNSVDANGSVTNVWTLNDANTTYPTLQSFSYPTGFQNFGFAINSVYFATPTHDQYNPSQWGNLSGKRGVFPYMFRVYNKNLTTAEMSYNGLNNNFRFHTS